MTYHLNESGRDRFERELEAVRAEVTELRAENKQLRSRLEDISLAVARTLGCIHDGETCDCYCYSCC